MLTDEARPQQAMERLRRRFPHTLVLGFAHTPVGSGLPAARPAGRSDHDIALDFVRDLRGAPATEAEATLLRDAVESCCVDPDLERV